MTLLKARGPSAVFWSVWAIVVDALYGRSFRTRPHVAHEGREIVAPLAAHRYATGSVILVVSTLWIQASLLHALPYVPERRVPHTMARLERDDRFPAQASAALGVSISDCVQPGELNLSTIAKELPDHGSALPPFGRSDSDKSSESLARYVDGVVCRSLIIWHINSETQC